jgi:hypothetical protein
MKIIVISLLSIAIIAVIAPTVSGEVFINEDELYPFSIEYPSNWKIVSTEPITKGGVMIDSDKTGRNGMWVGFWKDIVDINYNDYELLEFQKDNIKKFCINSTQEKHFGECSDLIFQTNKIQEIDGSKAVTAIMKYDWLIENPDPMFEDSTGGKFSTTDTLTWILSGNDIWVIATTNNADKFDKKQIHNIIHSFKFNNTEQLILEHQQKHWWNSIIDFFKLLFI